MRKGENMRIAVYLGSSFGNDPAYREAADEIGGRIAREGHTLIYGGSRVGLMGVLADAALREGGEVIGVEPRFFIEEGLVHEGITETIPTETMSERKTVMMEMADAYVAIPGGIGTLDEISEVIALLAVDRHARPCVLYNKKGYYDTLEAFFDEMTAAGFLAEKARRQIVFADTVDGVMEAVARRA